MNTGNTSENANSGRSTILGQGINYTRGKIRGLNDTVKNIDDGFALFVAGLIWFLTKLLFTSLSGDDFVGLVYVRLGSIIGGIGFAFFACLTVFRKKGLFLISLALASYYYFQNSTDLRSFLLILGVLGAWQIIHHRSSDREGFIEWGKNELIYGGIVIMAVAVDAELYYLLPKAGLNLTVTALGLIRLIPVWAILGAYSVDTEKHTSTFSRLFVGFCQIAAILYILGIIVYSSVPGYGYKLPDIAEISVKIEEAKVQAKTSGWTKIKDDFECIWEGATGGDPGGIDACKKKKTLDRECNQKCANDPNKDECITKCKEEKPDKSKILTKTCSQLGSVNIEIERDSDESSTLKAGEAFRFAVNVNRETANSKAKPVDVSLSCIFKSNSRGSGSEAENVGDINADVIGPSMKDIVTDTGSFFCRVPDNIEGSVQVVVKAVISNIQSQTSLTRIFTDETDRNKIKEIEQKYTQEDVSFDLCKPKNAPVIIRFGIGQPIKAAVNGFNDLMLNGEIVNEGNGKLIKINKAQIGCEAEEFSEIETSGTCELVKKDGVFINPNLNIGDSERGNIEMGTCMVYLSIEENSYVSGEINKDIRRDFCALIDYNYEIEKQFSITVKAVKDNAKSITTGATS